MDAHRYTRRPVEPWRQILVDAWDVKRLTLDELSDKTGGLNRGTIHRVLTGETAEPGFDTVVKIASAFGPDVSDRIAQSITQGRPELGQQRNGDDELTHFLDTFIARIDTEEPADDSVTGDILKAIAVLTRALRRGSMLRASDKSSNRS